MSHDRTPAAKPRGHLLLRLLFATGSCLVMLLVVEGVLRLLDLGTPVVPSIPYVSDPVLRYRPKPGGHWRGPDGEEVLGPRGYRGAPRDPAPVPGHHRLAVVGDSFVFGLEVRLADTFASRLDARLDDVDVWNLGAPGFCTEQEAGLLREELPRVDPDAVVLAFYTGNDFYENVLYEGQACLAEMVVPAAWVEALREEQALVWVERELELRRASHLYSLLVQKGLTAWLWGWIFPGAAALVRERGGSSVPERHRLLKTIYGALLDPSKRTLPEVREAIDRSLRALDGFDEMLRARSIPWLLLVIPDKEHVRVILERRHRARQAGKADPDLAVEAWAQEVLRGWAASRGVPCLDPLETFLADEDPMHLYAEGVHFSPAGHERVAQEVAAELASPRWRWRPRSR